MAGRDKKKRRIMEVYDPEGKYSIKAQLPFLGRRVIDFVLDELVKAKNVDKVYIVGQTKETLPVDHPVEYINVETCSTIYEKFQAILEHLEKEGKILEKLIFCSSDVPAIRAENIDEFIQAVDSHINCDLVISLVPISLGIEEFGSEHKRVVGSFTDAEVFPGEMYAISKRAIEICRDEIEIFSDRRKKRTFWASGIIVIRRAIIKPRIWGKVIKLLFRRASINDAKIIIENVFNITGDYCLINDLGFGFDLDLSEDFEKLEKYVKKIKPEAIKD